MKSSLCVATLALALFASQVAAEVVITAETKNLKSDPPAVDTQKIVLAADRMKVEGTHGGSSFTMIYRGDKETVWIVDPATKTYMALDKKSMHEMASELDTAMKQMQEQLAQMPPDQREMIEKMMKDKMPGASQKAKMPVLRSQSSGVKATVNGYPCVRYDQTADGQKKSEIWATSWDRAGVRKEEVEVFKKMGAMAKELVQSSPLLRDAASESQMWNGIDEIDGFPIKIVGYDGTTPAGEMLFKNIEHQKVDAAAFEIPAGYSQRSFGLKSPNGE